MKYKNDYRGHSSICFTYVSNIQYVAEKDNCCLGFIKEKKEG